MGSDIFIRKEIYGKDILWAQKDHHSSDFVIQEQQDVARLASFEEWHSALGHVSPAYMSSNSYADGHLIPSAPKNFECHHYVLSKSTKKVPPPATSNAKRPYELIHSDLSGKFSVQSLGKSYYYLSLIDDKTRFTWVRFLREKSDAVKCIKDFVKERKTQAQTTTDTATTTGGILCFRTDGSGEYVNHELREYFKSEGIIHEMSPPYSHESNGIAE